MNRTARPNLSEGPPYDGGTLPNDGSLYLEEFCVEADTPALSEPDDV